MCILQINVHSSCSVFIIIHICTVGSVGQPIGDVHRESKTRLLQFRGHVWNDNYIIRTYMYIQVWGYGIRRVVRGTFGAIISLVYQFMMFHDYVCQSKKIFYVNFFRRYTCNTSYTFSEVSKYRVVTIYMHPHCTNFKFCFHEGINDAES